MIIDKTNEKNATEHCNYNYIVKHLQMNRISALNKPNHGLVPHLSKKFNKLLNKPDQHHETKNVCRFILQPLFLSVSNYFTICTVPYYNMQGMVKCYLGTTKRVAKRVITHNIIIAVTKSFMRQKEYIATILFFSIQSNDSTVSNYLFL